MKAPVGFAIILALAWLYGIWVGPFDNPEYMANQARWLAYRGIPKLMVYACTTEPATIVWRNGPRFDIADATVISNVTCNTRGELIRLPTFAAY